MTRRGNTRSSNQLKKASGRAATSRRPIQSSRKHRTVVDHSYHDHYHDPKADSLARIEPDCQVSDGRMIYQSSVSKSRCPRGGVTIAFPEKLHEMLQAVEEEGLGHIISWQPHGRCFLIQKKKLFVDLIMPRFFHQTKLTSFQRQLNLYGFIRLTAGKDRGSYYHELFLRGRIDLCRQMIRTRIKGNGMKAAASPHTEPNFYIMEYCEEKVAEMDAREAKPKAEDSEDFPPTASLASSAGCEEDEYAIDETMEFEDLPVPENSGSPEIPEQASLTKNSNLYLQDEPAVVTPYSLQSAISAWSFANHAEFPYIPLGKDFAYHKTYQEPKREPSSSALSLLLSNTQDDVLNFICNDRSMEEDISSTQFDDEINFESEELPATGDEVYFAGSKFRYLDHLNMNQMATQSQDDTYFFGDIKVNGNICSSIAYV